MENLGEHSKAKLALALFTSPAAAFEEINRRKLLWTALVISAITGTLAIFPPLIAYLGSERVQWLVISQYNPIAWLGLTFLYVLAMQRLLKWIGAQVDYIGLLTLMGWAQLSMLVVEIFTILFAISGVTRNPTMASVSSAGIALFSLWYVVLMGLAVQALLGVNRLRGVLTYVVVQLAIFIGLTYTYVNTRVSGFEGTSRGIISIVTLVAYADKLPWAAAAVLGLLIGVAALAKHFGAPQAKMKPYAAGAALVGLVIFAAFAFGLHQAGYYAKLGRAQSEYVSRHYTRAAEQLEPLVHLTKDNGTLFLDLGDLYFLAGKDDLALTRYKQALAAMKHHVTWDTKMWTAQIHDGIGAVYDQQGKYPQAIAKFEEASKAWPEFREPWVRMAVTYDRMGKYDKALEADDHAMKKLESEATVAWVALAEASAQTGKTVQTKAAIAMVKGRDAELAARLGKNLDDWKTAVDRLTRQDLKYPLEREPAPAPKKGQSKVQSSKSKVKGR